MGKKSRGGSGIRIEMNIPDLISESLKTIFGLKDFNADADPGIFLTLDPGWKKFGSGTNIPYAQHWSRYTKDTLARKVRGPCLSWRAA
jgi:hypothetical protein